jgi:penicillin-binding protein 1A
VKEVISVDTARTMMILLQAVVQHGTGVAAAALKHAFGGKTGTTNNYTDAWFIGFSPSVTCGTWMGFDDRESLGEKETGAKAALPMWMDFMKVAVAGKPNESFSKPNAPKKQLDVPAAQPGGEIPKPPKDDDADKDTDDEPAPANTPDVPPPNVAPPPQTPKPVAPAKPPVSAPVAPTGPPQV